MPDRRRSEMSSRTTFCLILPLFCNLVKKIIYYPAVSEHHDVIRTCSIVFWACGTLERWYKSLPGNLFETSDSDMFIPTALITFIKRCRINPRGVGKDQKNIYSDYREIIPTTTRNHFEIYQGSLISSKDMS